MDAVFILLDEQDREIGRRTGQADVIAQLGSITNIDGVRYQIVHHKARFAEPQLVTITLRRCGVAANA